MTHAAQLTSLLDLDRAPVAISFSDEAPGGVAALEDSAVSGCTYWKTAADGKSFYTVAADHYGCPVGAHTHGIDLPENVEAELMDVIGTMVELHYIEMEEVPGIPQLEGDFNFASYAPLGDATFEAQVVLVTGNARQIMLLVEAAHAAGIATDGSMVGRPTCAAIPAVIQSGQCVTNLACIGNRIYTELADDQLYFAVAGDKLPSVLEKLEVAVNANNELTAYHTARLNA